MDGLNYVLFMLAGSTGGALAGMTVYRSRALGRSAGTFAKRLWLSAAGTLGVSLSVSCFAMAFGFDSPIFAIAVTLLVAAFTGLLNTVVQLKVPPFLRTVSQSEYNILSSPFSGLGLFSALLKKTPLKKLGGNVFLSVGRRGKLEEVQAGLADAEAVHVWGFALTLSFIISWGLRGSSTALLTSLVVALFLHVLPTANIRVTRYRLAPMSKRVARPF